MNLKEAHLVAVVESTPDLSYNGFRYDAFHMNKPLAERNKYFAADRDSLKQAFSEFKRCCEWLVGCQKIKTINNRVGSYSLKHCVERWATRRGIDDYYVSNGVFIAAAIHMGFNCKPIDGSPNAYFNISTKSPALLEDKVSR